MIIIIVIAMMKNMMIYYSIIQYDSLSWNANCSYLYPVVRTQHRLKMKQNEAQSARAESTHKGVN